MNYLYNGVELPELPDGTVWNRATHPHAYIRVIPAGDSLNPLGVDFYMLVVCKRAATGAKDGINIGDSLLMFITPKKGVASGDLEAVRGTWMYYGNMGYWQGFADINTIVWANTDIEYDGKVAYKATEPKPVGEETETIDPTSLLMGYRVGQMIAAMRSKKEPVAFLYNGVRLPQIPASVAAFRYQILLSWNDDPYDTTMIYGMSQPIFFRDGVNLNGDPIRIMETHAPATGLAVWLDTATGAWEDYGFEQTIIAPDGDTIDVILKKADYCLTMWANHNIYHEDGSLAVEASTPVPVYE